MDEIGLSNESVEYATLLDYSPRGITPGAILSRRLIRDAVKNVQHGIFDNVASLLKADAIPEINRFLTPDVILVPVPRSRPHQDFMPWPSLEICRAFERSGLDDFVWPGLRRTHVISRSCIADLGNRPDPEEHWKSLSVIGSVENASAFLLVDDFVTRGSTLVSSAAVMQAAFPNAEVKCFALVNTLSSKEELKNILNPRFGEISYQNKELNRSSWVEQVSGTQGDKVSVRDAMNR